MTAPDRREFLKLAATGGLLLTGVPTLAPASSGTGGGELAAVGERLRRNRNRIRTLTLDYSLEVLYVEPAYRAALGAECGLRPGRAELTFRSGRYRGVHKGGDFTGDFSVVELGSGPGRSVGWIRSQAPRQPSRMSLRKFLPVPAAGPLDDHGSRELDGQRCRVVGQDGVHFYVHEKLPLVVGVDVFAARQLAETIRYEDHRQIARGIVFPHRVIARRFVNGSEKARLRAAVHAVAANQD